MNSEDRDLVADMIRYAETAIRLLGTMDVDAVEADERTLLALCQAIEIIGEAANGVTSETQASTPDVPWKDAIAMRHRLIHGYRSIRVDVIVSTVREDLPPLIAALERALEDDAP